MNLTKFYPRIVKEIYHSPWLVLPSVHETLRKGFEAHLAGQQLPMEDEEENQDCPDGLPLINSTALIMVEGVIGKRLGMLEQCMGGCDLNHVAEDLDEAANNPDVSNILLYFNTPGGTVTGVPEIAEKINEISKVKPCFGYVDILCASAGYYMASQCDAIYCAPSAELGSVGVYTLIFDERKALDEEGIKIIPITAGKYKLLGASFKELTDEEKGMLQADVNNIYTNFKSAVLSKRSIDEKYLEGQVFNGVDAVNFGFADGLANDIQEVLGILKGI